MLQCEYSYFVNDNILWRTHIKLKEFQVNLSLKVVGMEDSGAYK